MFSKATHCRASHTHDIPKDYVLTLLGLLWDLLTHHEIVRANASLGELRRDKEKLSSPISCEFVRVKAS